MEQNLPKPLHAECLSLEFFGFTQPHLCFASMRMCY